MKAALIVICLALCAIPSLGQVKGEVKGEVNGTIGVEFGQLYDDATPNHRGYLIVGLIRPKSPGAEAGIQLGDIVVRLNGADPRGRELGDLETKEIGGATGGTVHLTVVRNETETLEFNVTRRPYPPRLNPESDPFSYSAPGDWRYERYPFPLPWAPGLHHTGFEDLLFADGFRDRSSPFYHSFVFLLWVEGKYPASTELFRAELEEYFLGVSTERSTRGKFALERKNISVAVKETGAQTDPKAPRYLAEVSMYDTFGQVIHLHVEIATQFHNASNHTALLFCLSPQERSSPVWKPLHAVWETFRLRN